MSVKSEDEKYAKMQNANLKIQNDKSKFKNNFIENFTFYNVILRFDFWFLNYT